MHSYSYCHYLAINQAQLLLKDAVTPADALVTVSELFAGARQPETLLVTSNESLLYTHSGELEHLRLGEGPGGIRYVPAQVALKAWIKPFEPLDGRIVPDRLSAHRLRLRARAMGLSISQQRFRSTYATYRFAQLNDYLEVCKELGWLPLPWPSPILSPVSRDEAERFFALTPDACGRPDWADEVHEWLHRSMEPK